VPLLKIAPPLFDLCGSFSRKANVALVHLFGRNSAFRWVCFSWDLLGTSPSQYLHQSSKWLQYTQQKMYRDVLFRRALHLRRTLLIYACTISLSFCYPRPEHRLYVPVDTFALMQLSLTYINVILGWHAGNGAPPAPAPGAGPVSLRRSSLIQLTGRPWGQ
jgi:hypothetical protein